MDETTMTASLENLLEPAANTVPLHGRDAIAAMQLKSREEYRRVVFALAQDEEPGTVEMNSLLFSVGKSFDQLGADVERVRQRKEWAKQREQAEEWKTEADQATTELAKVKAEAEKLSQEFKKKIDPLIARQVELREQASRLIDRRDSILEMTKRELERTASTAVDDEIAAAQKRHSDALKMINVYRTDYGCDTPWTAQNDARLQQLEESIRQQKARQGYADEDDVNRAHLLRRKKQAYPQFLEVTKRQPELQQALYDAYAKKLNWENAAL